VLKEKLLPKKDKKFSAGSEKSIGICCANEKVPKNNKAKSVCSVLTIYIWDFKDTNFTLLNSSFFTLQ
jgi:hypothetical protein